MTIPLAAPKSDPAWDLLLVGGGLQNALIALAVLERRPNASLALLEASHAIGGNHTWSFHSADVPDRARAIIEPLVVQRWAGYDVAFPGFERQLSDAYSAISSERLRAVVSERLLAAPNAVALTGAHASEVTGHSVTLSNGTRLTGRLVIDARGPRRFAHPDTHAAPARPRARGAVGYQKFLGLELEIEPQQSTARSVPLLMDATVPQTDGLRFFYVLPFSATRVLVEDTYFSDSASMDAPELRAQILAYADRAGLVVRAVVREEQGVLPLPTRRAAPPRAESPLLAGYAGGWFHPATGYSFPAALRLALHIAEAPFDEVFGSAWLQLTREHDKQFAFGALLNRLLFGAFSPADRWHALARFYRLPEGVIRRFYSLNTTSTDRMRLLCGRPPSGLSLRAVLSRGNLA
ncbi:MAG: lycopene beta-cyclase CrtY [Pseudomonadota bacterium]